MYIHYFVSQHNNNISIYIRIKSSPTDLVLFRQ